ncbi:MAG TPA: tRNA preQ1(34) S-adenosylmethionine ribosyltransferase-isomerase QueA [Pirellulales bacterium]|jgi:S-adenosylmethionine:tRNA ribosyltransferase-isomerase|nr:tRNA preQ1(34) S-adenosylmethionine ribosyltransferase-isomerase QueA [Pirellulales bacterium]
MSELDAYDYELPHELIAQEPLAHRADARLLVVDRARDELSHRHVRDLPEILRAGDLMVLNDTRVVPARLVGHRTMTGGRWEGLFLSVDEQGLWRLLARGRGKMAIGETITLVNAEGRDDIRLRLVERAEGGVWIMHAESDRPALEVLDRVGRVPLPPYIRHGEMAPADRERYQTVFARQPGAVAAPTAGLHFTDELLRRAEAAGIGTCFVTLHVGLDTFRPVTAERLADHSMHREWGELGEATAEKINVCRAHGGRAVAVGTTSVRVLETAAQGNSGSAESVSPWSGLTDLFIRPPYRFRLVDALLTNFHLPRTTLLVLVHTFGGDRLLKRAYAEAIAHGYRFYSYGDAMLIV